MASTTEASELVFWSGLVQRSRIEATPQTSWRVRRISKWGGFLENVEATEQDALPDVATRLRGGDAAEDRPPRDPDGGSDEQPAEVGRDDDPGDRPRRTHRDTVALDRRKGLRASSDFG